MKKIKTLLIVMMSILLCTACGNKTAITGDKFYDKTNEEYTVKDIGDFYDFAKSAYQVDGLNSMKITFVEAKNNTVAQSLFVDESQNVYTAATADLTNINKDNKSYKVEDDDVDDTVTKGDNYSIVEVRTSDTYYRVVWIDNTVMFGSIKIDSKTQLLNVMKGLGY